MSAVISLRVAGDVEQFRGALVERAEEMKEIAARAQQSGAIHHRFGVGDGVVLVVDEWERAEQFEAFFSSPELQCFVASVGGAGTPQITVTEAIFSPDEL